MLHSSTHTSRQQQHIPEKQRAQLITVDRKYSLMNKEVKKQVELHLENELNYLLGKKELDLMRKKKAKQIEEAFERQRVSQISKMGERASRSEKVRAQTLREKQGRSRRNLEAIDSRIKRQAQANESALQKMLEAQQEYIKRVTTSRITSQSLRRSNSNFSNFNSNFIKTELQKSLDNIDSKIQLIQSRIDKAKTNQQFYQRQKSERAKSFYKNVNDTREMIDNNFCRKETKCIQEYYGRMTHIIDCQEKSKSFYQQQSERRKKNIDERFKKCNQNLKEINSQREMKLQELQDKFDSQSLFPKTERSRKGAAYLERLKSNQKTIEQQQALKAEAIVSKHLNLSLKNRALREKKDRIFQAIRRDPA